MHCDSASMQPVPGVALPAHASAGAQAQFLSRHEGMEPFVREYPVLDLSVPVPRPWWLRLSGYNLPERTGDDPPAPVLAGRIMGAGRPAFVGQARVSWGATNLDGGRIVVDVGGGCTLWIPPTRSITVAAMLPLQSRRWQEVGGAILPAGPEFIGPTGGFFLHQLFSVSAQQCDATAGIRRARVSIMGNIAAAAPEPVYVPIPAGATHVYAYDGPQAVTAPEPVLHYRWMAWDGDTLPSVVPLATFLPNTRQAVPGIASSVQVNADAVNAARFVLVFELEH